MVTYTFDATQHQAQGERSGFVPAGEYVVAIAESEGKNTRNNDGGKILNLTLKVLDGEHTNHNHVERFNVVNANADTVRIAHQALASLSYAAGAPNWSDTTQLHNIPFKVRFSADVEELPVRDGQGNIKYGTDGKPEMRQFTRNNVQGYYALDGRSGQQIEREYKASGPQALPRPQQPGAQQVAAPVAPQAPAQPTQPQQPAQPAQQPTQGIAATAGGAGGWGPPGVGQPGAAAPAAQPQASPAGWGGQPTQAAAQPAQAAGWGPGGGAAPAAGGGAGW